MKLRSYLHGLGHEYSSSPLGRTVLWVGWAILGAALISLATIQTDIRAQLLMSGVLILLLINVRRFVATGWSRLAFLFAGAFIALRYLIWRTSHTLGYSDLVSFGPMIALYLAELYSLAVFGLNIFVNLNPLHRRPVPLSADSSLWPTVDVFVPSYDENDSIIETTLLAARQIRYPADKLRIYLLDDGGTQQKRAHVDLVRAEAAWKRHVRLQAYCESIGAYYLTREKNEHAKAGNLNAGLAQTSGELILTLDADHVPTVDILEKTVGWFERDPELFLLQTPHFFINPDPVERNLKTFHEMPSENEMFYKVIQKGLDFWNATFFCGSAAVLRRSYLMSVGGIAGETVTEDAETALSLHARGYRSAYLAIPLISGLSPETFSSLIIQRIRWAQGMVQILLLKNPLVLKGLSLGQRLCYFSNCFFWFFAYARIVFLLAPVAFLVFGLHIYNANWPQFFAFALPQLIATVLVSDYLFGAVRWSFVSELYELLQSVYTFRGILEVLGKPRALPFKVTPKGEHLSEDFISPLIVPLYVFTVLTSAAVIAGLYRLIFFPHAEDMYAVIITLFWSLFNAMLLLAAMGALFEHRQRRTSSRISQILPAHFCTPSKSWAGEVVDLSVGGLGLLLPTTDPSICAVGFKTSVAIQRQLDRSSHDFHVVVRNVRPEGDKLFVGLEFCHASLAERANKIRLVLGDSDRWIGFQQSRERKIGVWRSVLFLLSLGLVFIKNHVLFFQERYRTSSKPGSPASLTNENLTVQASSAPLTAIS